MDGWDDWFNWSGDEAYSTPDFSYIDAVTVPEDAGLTGGWGDVISATDVPSGSSMLDQGGYAGLGIGNPGSYGGITITPIPDATAVAEANSASSSLPSWLTSLLGGSSNSDATGLSGLLGGTISNSTLSGLLGAGIAAYGASQQNKLATDAKNASDQAAAAAAASAAKYSSPLKLVNARASIAPVARKGASEWFSNNRLPTYAEGGEVDNNRNWAQYARGGLSRARPNYVRGPTLGQADEIPSALSHGEYIMDSDVVSALGDGNNEAGAAKLDQMRKNIRAHKRSAPASSIPPKAKSTKAYMKGTK